MVIVTSGSFGDVFGICCLPVPSRMDALARNSQLSQGDFFKVLFVSTSLDLYKAIQRNAGCFLLSTKVVVLLLPANRCLLMIVQCGYTSQISRSLALFMLQAEVSVPFFCQFVVRHLPSRLDPLARNSQVSQGDVSHELLEFNS